MFLILSIFEVFVRDSWVHDLFPILYVLIVIVSTLIKCLIVMYNATVTSDVSAQM